MLFIGIFIAVIITLLSGFLIDRLIRKQKSILDTLLYSVGFGTLFNLIVGLVANFRFGMEFKSLVVTYIALLLPLTIASVLLGKKTELKWNGWKSAIIPLVIYLVALGLQLQTTLMSPNLVGSDVHLEYFVSNLTLEQGKWNPLYGGTTLNACLGLTVLFPVYKIMTGMTLMWVFKIIAPMMFAIVPLILYRIFKPQFGTLVSVLAVVFFIATPMFTMDLVQLVRQQQSELFFALVIFVLVDDNLTFWWKIALGTIFSVGVMITHLGMAIGIIGYLSVSSIMAFFLAWVWKNKVDDIRKKLSSRIVLIVLAVITIGLYAGYYSWVNSGWMLSSSTIPIQIAQNTINNPDSVSVLNKEPLAQTAIGLDFLRVSTLGKLWRILQYLVEICLVVGFLRILFKPLRSINIEYMSFVVASGFVILGLYFMSNYGWGLGTARVWGITLLFMSPLFVVGLGTIGGWIARVEWQRTVLPCFLIIFIPYFAFNSGAVFEIAKLQPKTYIDVPYSIALSGHRVDVASIFTEKDVEAMDWLKQNIGVNQTIYGDTHTGNLFVQRIYDKASFKYIWQMSDNDSGYVFLREWNIENNEYTAYGDYGARQSLPIDGMMQAEIAGGKVLFDNGARVILASK